MPNHIVCKPGAIDNVNAFSTSPEDKSEADVVGEVKDALRLATDALIAAQKKALSFRVRYKNGNRRDRKEVRDDWNGDRAFRFLGPAPIRKGQFKAVHRRLRKLADRIRKTEVVIRPHTGSGSGRCSNNTNSLGYIGRMTSGGRVNLCPKFFLVREIEADSSEQRRTQGAARQAGVLIHELTHSLGLTGKGHKETAGGRNDEMFRKMRSWADSNGKKARKNPSSYEAMITFIATESR